MRKLQEIANILTLTQWNTLGVKGKMTVCVYFYMYSRLSGVRYYEEMANKLLDEVFDNITKMDISFENGLCGIGCMLNYLTKENYIEMDRDALFDIDERLQKNISLLPDINNDYAVIPSVLYITSLDGMPKRKFKYFKSILDMSDFYLDNIDKFKHPLRVANSILHFLNFLELNGIYKKRTKEIYKKTLVSLPVFINNSNNIYYDVETLKEIIRQSDKDVKEITNTIDKLDYSNISIDEELKIDNLWQSFFYFPDVKREINDIEEYFDKKLFNIQFNSSNIKYAFLGICIIKNMKQ